MTSSVEAGGPPVLRSKWLVLLAACMGNLVLTLDSGVMGVSYPALAEAFDTDTSTILWVSVAFWVTGVGMVMTLGWLSDVGGRRLAYTLGFVLYSAALGLSAISVDLWQLIASRIFMGVGSAMVMAGVNAIILDRFEPQNRGRAIGIAGAVVGLGLTTGPLAGGWLLDVLGWQALFYTRIPLALIAAALSWWVLENPKSSGQRDLTVDWLGAVTLFTVLASFLVVVNRGAEDGLFSPLVLAAAALLAVSVTRADRLAAQVGQAHPGLRSLPPPGIRPRSGRVGLPLHVVGRNPAARSLLLHRRIGLLRDEDGPVHHASHADESVPGAGEWGADSSRRPLDAVRCGPNGHGVLAVMAQRAGGLLRLRAGDTGGAPSGGRGLGAVRAAEHHHDNGVGAGGPLRDRLSVDRVGAPALVFGRRSGGRSHLRGEGAGIPRRVRGRG